MSNELKTSIQFLKINERAFLIQRPTLQEEGKFDTDYLRFGINIKPSVNLEEEHFYLFVTTEYLYSHDEEEFNKEEAECIMRYAFEAIFQIPGLADVVTIDQDTNELTAINKKMLTTIFSISFSMARGILYDRSRNTFIEDEGLHLPVINPKAYIENSNIPLESEE